MTWVRYDDNVANHPKVAPLDDATYRLWRESIEWCAHNLTDGRILTNQLAITSIRASKARANRLVVCGLWHPAGMACMSPKCPPSGEDGWVIHDYWDYQPTREKVRAEQLAKAERQAKWLSKRKDGQQDAKKDTSHVASSDASTNASYNGAPAPPRPAPKGGGDVPSPSRARRAASPAAPPGRREDQTTVAPGVLFHPPPAATPPAELLEATRRTLRAASAKAGRKPAGNPFDPPPDKAQQALARLDQALAAQQPPPAQEDPNP